MSQQFSDQTESFERIRKDIKEILFQAHGTMDMAQIYVAFKLRHKYLPDIERRMRELIENHEVTKTTNKIAKYKLAE